MNIIERIKSDRKRDLNVIREIIKLVADNERSFDCDYDDVMKLMSHVLENEKSRQSGVLFTPYGIFKSIESFEAYLRQFEPDKLNEDVNYG